MLCANGPKALQYSAFTEPPDIIVKEQIIISCTCNVPPPEKCTGDAAVQKMPANSCFHHICHYFWEHFNRTSTQNYLVDYAVILYIRPGWQVFKFYTNPLSIIVMNSHPCWLIHGEMNFAILHHHKNPEAKQDTFLVLLQKNLRLVSDSFSLSLDAFTFLRALPPSQHSFVNSVSEKGFLCLPRTHATFIEASMNLAVSLILQLFCWYNDLGMFIVIVTALLWPLFHCKSSPWSCASQGQHEHEFLSTLILKCFHFLLLYRLVWTCHFTFSTINWTGVRLYTVFMQ